MLTSYPWYGHDSQLTVERAKTLRPSSRSGMKTEMRTKTQAETGGTRTGATGA